MQYIFLKPYSSIDNVLFINFYNCFRKFHKFLNFFFIGTACLSPVKVIRTFMTSSKKLILFHSNGFTKNEIHRNLYEKAQGNKAVLEIFEF